MKFARRFTMRRFLRINFSPKHLVDEYRLWNSRALVFVVSRFASNEKFHSVCHMMGTSKGAGILQLFPSNSHFRFACSLLSALFRDILPRVVLIRSAELSYHVSYKWKSYVLCRPFTILYALRPITWAGKLSHHVTNKIVSR